MKDTTVAARYARALFIVTEKRKETTRALEDLKGAWEVLRPGTRAGTMLATPQVRMTDKRAALRTTFENRVLRIVAVFIDLLLRKRRLGELETIVHEFEALVERMQGIQRAHAVSAVPLAAGERDRLHGELERTTGKKIKMTTEVDGELIGGVLVRIGDRVIDRSVRTLLEKIEQQLLETNV